MKKLKYMTFLGLSAGLLFTQPALAYTKNETVYSKLNYDGTVTKTMVTNQLMGDIGEEIEDEAELFDLLALNKKKDLQVEGKTLKWKSDGKSLFYQGSTEKDIDIQVSIKYYLDGEEKKANEIVGQKGHVKIVYTFKNNMENTVMVGGRKEVLYTPFVVTLGTMIQQENAENVTISSGKVINNGNSYMVAGLTLPGLYESLGIDSLKELNTLTLEYDTESCSLSQVYFVATPKLIEESDITLFDDLKKVYANLDTLKQSINAIEEGTGKLENGASALNEGAGTLSSSLQTVLTSITTLQNGSTSVTNGLATLLASLKKAEEQLSAGVDLSSMNVLKEKNDVAITSLKTANTSLETIYTTNHLESVTKEQLVTLGYDEATIKSLLTVKKTYEANLNLIALLEANNTAIATTLSTFSSLQSQIITLVTQLENGASTLYQGSNQVGSGIGALKEGISQIYTGSLTLKEGTNTLKEGTKEVNQGVHQFNEEGISKLISYKNHLQSYTNKVDALMDLSKKYNGYASNNSEVTNFIYTVSSLKK